MLNILKGTDVSSCVHVSVNGSQAGTFFVSVFSDLFYVVVAYLSETVFKGTFSFLRLYILQIVRS